MDEFGHVDDSRHYASWGLALGVYLCSTEVLKTVRSNVVAEACLSHALSFAMIDDSLRALGLEPPIGALEPNAAGLRLAAVDFLEKTRSGEPIVVQVEAREFWRRILPPEAHAPLPGEHG